MNLKKFIYNLFFKKKRTNSSKKNAAVNGDGATSAIATTTPSGSKPVHTKGKYDTSVLRQQVSETEYISNLRIGRSWILPQLIQMGFKKSGMSRKFDILYFENNIHKKYDISQSGRNEIWTLLKRNYKIIAETDGSTNRAKWWTKELLVEMMKWDFKMTGKRSRGFDRCECKEILASIEDITDTTQIYDAVVRYDESRMRTRSINTYRSSGHTEPLPECFIDAFMGDGAYCAMMTMVKVLDIRFDDGRGNVLTRDECLSVIEEQSVLLNGRELLEYCKEVFFDSGAFEYKKYVKK